MGAVGLHRQLLIVAGLIVEKLIVQKLIVEVLIVEVLIVEVLMRAGGGVILVRYWFGSVRRQDAKT